MDNLVLDLLGCFLIISHFLKMELHQFGGQTQFLKHRLEF